MAALKILQNVFNGGEISPLLAGRIDQPRYKTGAYLMRNAIPLPQGGVTRRPGTIYAGRAATQGGEHGCVRMVPFVYDGQHRMLEFYNKGMRVWYANGTRVLAGDEAIYAIKLPYLAEDIQGLSLAQSADVIYIASQKYPPAKLCRYADTDWRYEVLVFKPKISTPTPPALKADGNNPGTGQQTYAYKIVAVDGETGELSQVSRASEIKTDSLSATWNITVSWQPVAGAVEYRVYKRRAGLFGFIGRAVDGTVTFVDNNITPDTGDTPTEYKTPFEAVGDYPGIVFFHQQRLGFAATEKKPLTIWLSQSANFENLGASIPPKDDDGIEATIAGQRQSRILWCTGDNKSLCIGTSGGEWLMEAPSGGVFSPSNHGFAPQGDKGSLPGLSAISTGDGLAYVQRGGGAVQIFNYSFQEDKYTSTDLSLLAPHILFDKKITSWSWQALPYGILFTSLSDGTMAGLTLLREHDVVGWHRHDTDGHIEQVASLPSAGGEHDLLWMCVVRRINGIPRRFIEVMAPYFLNADADTAYFVDCGVSSYETNGQVVYNLEHLENKSVAAFTDGFVQPMGTVKRGQVELDRAVNTAHVGLPYTTEIRPTVPEFDLQDGTTLGRLRQLVSCKLRVCETLVASVQAGVAPRDKPAKLNRTRFSQALENTPKFTELADVDLTIGSGWREDGSILIKVDDPTPFTLLAVVLNVDVASGAKGHQA